MSCFQIPGDLALNEKETDIVLRSGIELVSQRIRVGAQIFRGTWRADRRKGIPYLQSVLVKGQDPAIVRAVFYGFLIGIEGVEEVSTLSLQYDRPDRILRVLFTVRTDTGELLSDEIAFEVAD